MTAVKALHSVVATILTLTVTAGVICTLACPHEAVRTFCPAGHHDCCPKQNSSTENCLTSNFVSTSKHMPVVAVVAEFVVNAEPWTPFIAEKYSDPAIALQEKIGTVRSVVLRI
jgi:hypothetical protein